MNPLRSILISWVDRRIERGYFPLRETRRGTSEFHKHLGGRSIYAKLILEAEPAETFSFTSEVTWPDPKPEYYESFVLDGILDELFTRSWDSIFGLKVRLVEIGWHEVDSCAAGYYQAARLAMKQIIEIDEKRTNIKYERIKG